MRTDCCSGQPLDVSIGGLSRPPWRQNAPGGGPLEADPQRQTPLRQTPPSVNRQMLLKTLPSLPVGNNGMQLVVY